VETILSHVKRSELTDEHRPRMLDLACGPGLYAQQFASHGFSVTGIDFSEVSIRHAREEAEREGLDIEYRREDLTTAKLGGPYDVVTLIYGEFCTFSERERRKLLRRIRKSLAPGGLFVVDVFTEAYVRRNRSCDDWYVSAADGFWQASPHMVLLRHFFYPADSASVARYTIVDENGSYRQFNVWWRHYDAGEIRELMDSEGFDVEQLYGSLWGEAYDPNGEWIGVYARAAT
jgi:SAM-dependent methyltransferase